MQEKLAADLHMPERYFGGGRHGDGGGSGGGSGSCRLAGMFTSSLFFAAFQKIAYRVPTLSLKQGAGK